MDGPDRRPEASWGPARDTTRRRGILHESEGEAGLQPDESSPRLIFLCLVAGTAVFVSVMVGLAWWAHRDAVSTRRALESLEALSLTGSINPGDTPGVTGSQLPRLQPSQARVFFTADDLRLHPQTIEIPSQVSRHARLRFVLERLLQGPSAELLRSTIPPGVGLRGAYLLRDMAVVDLTAEIAEKPFGGPMGEILCAGAIVNTVIENVEDVETVKILIDGETRPVLWDQVDIQGPLVADISLVEY